MSPLILASLVAVFVAVGLIAGAVTSMLLSMTATERRRLFAVTQAPRPVVLQDIMSVTSPEEMTGGWQYIAKILPRRQKDLHRLRARLARAGFRAPGAPVVYTLIELVVPPVVGIAVAVYMAGTLAAWVLAGLAAVLAFYMPGLIVEHRLNKRRRAIRNGLPDALDLLVVCIEAGSGLDQAIVKTAEELALAYPALADEFRILTMEIRAGKPRIEAFKSLAQRTKIDEMRSMVAMLVQTERFGTSVGQALRTHADSLRVMRRQAAEEAAQKIGVKLVFPLVLFFFPAFYVVVLGPAVIQFIRVFIQR